jgi:hypothetical protein
MNEIDNSSLANLIADGIFAEGEIKSGGEPITRIAFKSGRWTPDYSEEVHQGGLCRSALVNVIKDILDSQS